MSRLLMIDSGAFTVWSKGATVDLDSYIQFCLDNPQVSYYVNLDVIPGRFRQKKTIQSPIACTWAAEEGWDNYQKMIEHGVPKNKLIPVFHRSDPIYILKRYLNAGVKYIGISPANDDTTSQKIDWLKEIRPYLFDGNTPVVKTHGFAVTSYRLMTCHDKKQGWEWEWHSVDSASWKLAAAWGALYIPVPKGSGWDYTKPPRLAVASSGTLPKVDPSRQIVLLAKGKPTEKAVVRRYLDQIGVPLGTIRKVDRVRGYTPNRKAGEYWIRKPTRLEPIGQTAIPEEPGVVNDWEWRAIANALFMFEANKVLPIKHIYFAGAPIPNLAVEKVLNNRLLSFHEVGKRKDNKPHKCLRRHFRFMKKEMV